MKDGHLTISARLAAAAALALVVAACAADENGPAAEETTPRPTGETVPAEDVQASDEAQFALALLDTAYEGEEELARIAADRAESPRVRAHAEDLLRDFDRIVPEVSQAAEEANVDLDDPQGVGRQVSQEIGGVYDEERQSIEGLEGEAFDRAYLSSTISTHRATIAELERIQAQIEDPEVQEFVQQQIPLLQRQLERARDVAEREGLEVGS